MNHSKGSMARVALWVTRCAFLAVFVINVMCALEFVLQPDAFMGSYQLSGVPGRVAVAGIGVAFLMWNCTYPLVILHPDRHRTLGIVVLAQQCVGLVGESLILFSIPSTGYEILQGSILRFIAFDGGGLVIMLATFLWLQVVLKHSK